MPVNQQDFEDLSGRKFGKLTVVGRAASDVFRGAKRQRIVAWDCLCDCGRSVTVDRSSLKNGNTTSCRCTWRKRDTDKGEQFWLRVTYRYMSDAKKRGLEWRLTDEQAVEMLGKPCAYCGAAPEIRTYGKGERERSGLANGIDRVDNSSGYSMLNCVPCCPECNMSKKTRTAEEFIEHCKRVARHNGLAASAIA